MKQRTLGCTGLRVSEIGFGCGPTAALMITGTALARREAVAAALDLGINYFDTAPGYGANLSETHLGKVLHELAARPVVATKVALTWEQLDDIGGSIERSVEASLRRLQLSELALIQLHNRIGAQRAERAEFGTGALLTADDVLGPDGVLAAFDRLRSRGLVRHFGCSAFGGDMKMVQRLIDSDTIEVLTVHYSVLNSTAWNGKARAGMCNYSNIGARAAACNMGIVALRVLEGGVLATQGADSSASQQPHEVRSISSATGVGVTESAVRFALSNDDLSVVLIGFSDVEQIRQCADYSRRGRLPDQVLAALDLN